jgi:tetratricopeptide (TPR) repeat protein
MSKQIKALASADGNLNWCCALVLAVCFAWAGTPVVAKESGDAESKPTAELLAEIESLVTDLGADEFQVREEAEARLSEMGLAAYETLLRVRDDKDIEVRLRSRHIVDSLRGRFMTTGVSEEIGPWMATYHDQDRVERTRRIEEVLAKLLPESGADGLARIARFEADERLSRLAALQVVSLPIEMEKPREEMVSMVSTGIGFSERTAVKWLRNYVAAANREPAALQQWHQLIEDETDRDLMLEESEDHRTEYVFALRLVAIDTANVLGNQEAAAQLVTALSSELDSEQEILNWFKWLQSRRAWSSIADFAKTQRKTIESNPQLLYGLAEAEKKLGKHESASATAAKALDFEGLSAEARCDLATDLKSNRGMYEWAEAEFRKCMELSGPTEQIHYRGAIRLGELLHDLEREEEAADLLDSILVGKTLDKKDRRDKEKVREFQLQTRALQAEKAIADTRARAAFFRACHYRDQGEIGLEKEELVKGLEAAKDDVDILIAMHTVAEPTPEWTAKTERRIREVNADYRSQLQVAYRTYEQLQDNLAQREVMRAGLAVINNQYAWLVGNTIGDIDQAIHNSHKSLEFAPGDGGFLDTLGRCYYRAGRLEEAAKYQRMAVERAPFELQIQRQLKLILTAIEERDAANQNAASHEIDAKSAPDSQPNP